MSEQSQAPVPPSADGRSAWRRLLEMGRPRATKANVLATVLALTLGFAIATQVHQTQSQGLESLREDELVRILDDVTQDSSRLATEIAQLQSSRDRLQSGVATGAEARKAAQDRLDTLGILAGTVPTKGPGIIIRIGDPKHAITSPLLLDALEELRDAGAEAIQINGVRVVASTYFTDVDGGVAVSGVTIQAPYTIRAVGDSSTLAAAMDIPGGVTESVRSVQAEVTVSQPASVVIDALHTVEPPQYARPVTATPSEGAS